MASGDSSMEVVAQDERPRQKQEQPWSSSEETGLNPLDPRFSEYDPKQGQFVHTRFFFRDKFDLDIESPIGPMRHTDKIFKGLRLRNSVNVISVKIVSSDYGYPLNIYATVIARDSGSQMRLLFQRGEDNCQFISSKDDLLILTSPNRGFMVCDAIFFEIDLKVKDAHGRKVKDERFSKGLL